MRFFFIRHGEMKGDPFCKPERPVEGCLSDRGLNQAACVHEFLKDVKVDFAFSSPYGRALQTCEIALEGHDTPITIVPEIYEWMPDRSLEKLPSTKFEEIRKANTGLYPDEEWKTPLGEGCFDMYARVIPAFIRSIQSVGINPRHGGFVPDEGKSDLTLAYFAHGGSLSVLVQWLVKVQPFPCGVISLEPGGVIDVRFSERHGVYYPALHFPTPCKKD